MFHVQVLGTSAAVPAHGRNVSAQVVSYNERLYLVDCGEGTQHQIVRYKVKSHRIDAIFISHLHGDHILGLPGLLSTFSLEGRDTRLKIFAPFALQGVLRRILDLTYSYLSYKLDFVPLEDFLPGDIIFSTHSLQVRVIPLIHRIEARGFLFEEINKNPKFDFYKAKALEIPNIYFHLLKQGNTITLEDGRVIHPEAVLVQPDPPKKFAYCSDTIYNPEMIPHIRECDLLYHEATFADNLQHKAAETMHSTTKEAARIALEAQVKKLLLGHFSARYKDLTPLIEEAQSIFPQTEAAKDGEIYTL